MTDLYDKEMKEECTKWIGSHAVWFASTDRNASWAAEIAFMAGAAAMESKINEQCEVLFHEDIDSIK